MSFDSCILERSRHSPWSPLLFIRLFCWFVLAKLIATISPSLSQSAGHAAFGHSLDVAFSCSDDGSDTAPPGLPQHPNLLRDYKKISPCQVAGVNFAVGYGNNSLKDPVNCDCLPKGTTVDDSHHFIRVTGTPNVTLSGFDFSLHGGYLVYCDGSRNLTVKNSNFAMGSNGTSGVAGINADCANMSIMNNVFDDSNDGARCRSWSVIMTMGSGITLRYNWIKNFSQHVLEANGGGAVDYRYNLIEEGGWCSGAHLNYSQLQGSYPHPQIAFNTFVQHVQAAGGEGIQIGMQSGSDPVPRLLSDMFFRQIWPATAERVAQSSTVITDAQVEYNTMISVPIGPRKALSYMIACHQDVGAVNIGFVARNNYLDPRGAFGPFYPRRCSASNYISNWNMVTGFPLTGQP